MSELERSITLSGNLAAILGTSTHPLVHHAILLEQNLILSDDVIIAMAGRAGLYIPPVDYGDVRAFRSDPDGQYAIREYSHRLKDVARECARLHIPAERVQEWILTSPEGVGNALSAHPDLDAGVMDEENEYYLDRVPLLLRLTSGV